MKKVAFRVIGVILVILGVFQVISAFDNEEKLPPDDVVIEYTAYSIDEMINDLNANALLADEKYNGQYLEITGVLRVVDSDGKYIGLYSCDPFDIDNVKCDIITDEQKQQVMKMSVGDTVTLKGKVTDVGEIFGYSLDIYEIVSH